MSLRGKSKRRILIVLALAVASTATLGTAYVVRKSILRSQAIHAKDLGYAAIKAKDYENALPLLGKYLTHFPVDTEALYDYALARESVPTKDGGNIMEAIGLWRHLLDLNPDNLDARHHLVELYLKVGFKNETLDAANAILARTKDDPAALHAKAIAQFRLSKLPDALATIQYCNQIYPNNIENQIFEISIRSAKGDTPADILHSALELQKAHPTEASFDLLVSVAQIAAGNQKAAITAARAAASRPASDPSTVSRIVHQLDALSLFQEGLTAALTANSQHPGEMPYLQLAAHRLFLSGDYAQLSAMLKDIDANNAASDPQLLALRGLSILFEDPAKDASSYFDAVRRHNDPIAIALVDAALTVKMDASNSPQAVDICRKALAADPSNPILLYLLGEAYARQGEGDIALREWKSSCLNAPEWAVPMAAIAGAFLSGGQPAEAYTLARAAQLRAPNDKQTLMTLAASWAAVIDPKQPKDIDQLLDLLNRMEVQFPAAEELRTIHVNLLVRLDRRPDAIKLLQDSLTHTPPLSEATLLQLAAISQTNKFELTSQCFDASEHAHGMTPNLAYAKAILLAQNDHAAEGLTFLESLMPKQSPNAQWQLAHARYLDLLRDPRAQAAWKSLALAFPEDLNVQWAALNSPVLQGDHELLGQIIDHIQVKVGDQDLRARLARARWLLQGNPSEKDTSEASVLLSDITHADPNLVEPRLLLAHCMQELGNISGAIDQLRAAAGSHPDINLIALELARLLIVHGETDNARVELDRAVKNGLTSPDREQVAVLYAGIGAYDVAESLLQTETGTTHGALMLATLYMKEHQSAKVDEICRKLMQDPTPESIQFYAAFLVSQGRQAEAQQVLAKLDSITAAPGRRELARAGYLARFGTVEEATEQYLAAIKLAPADETAWHQLLVLRFSAGKTEDIASIIANAHKAIPKDAAVNALNDDLSFLPLAADSDGRAFFTALITAPKDAAAITEGLQLLQEMKAQKQPPESFLPKMRKLADQHPRVFSLQSMAIHYLAQARQFNDAATLALQATQVFPDSSDAAQLASATLAAAGRWNEALSAARHWRAEFETPPIQTDLIIAEAQLNTGQFDDCLHTLKPYLDHALTAPDQNQALIAMYAQGLVSTGKVNDARQLFQPLLSSPLWRSKFIQLAVRLPNEKDTVSWLQQADALIPPAALQEKVQLAVGYHELALKTRNAGYEQNVLSILEPVAANPDCDAQTLMVLGSLYETAKQLSAAEKAYRRSLEKKPDQPLVLNNLAMVLVNQNGNLDEAEKDAAKAVQLAPSVPNFYDTQATIFASQKSYDRAIASIAQAIKLSPADPDWEATRIWLLAASGQQKTATSEYQRLQLTENFPKLSADSKNRLVAAGLK